MLRRAIVPGWFGMASVKWLRRVIASAAPFHGYFRTIEYAACRVRPKERDHDLDSYAVHHWLPVNVEVR